MPNTNIKDLANALETFLTDTRAERERLTALAKQTKKVTDNTYKLLKTVDKLIKMQEEGETDAKNDILKHWQGGCQFAFIQR